MVGRATTRRREYQRAAWLMIAAGIDGRGGALSVASPYFDENFAGLVGQFCANINTRQLRIKIAPPSLGQNHQHFLEQRNFAFCDIKHFQ